MRAYQGKFGVKESTMKRKKYIILAVILVAVILVIARAVKKSIKPPVETEQEEKALPVEVEKASMAAMPETVEAIGNIEPFKKVVIFSEATEILEKLTVREGDFVKAGELIAAIEGEQRKLTVKQLENEIKSQQYQLENLKSNYERNKRLADQGVIAPKNFEDTETQYNSALYRLKALEAQMETAKRRLKDTAILAPISGMVAQKFMDEGELVTESTMTKSDPIVSIVDISRVKITVPVGESDIKKVKANQKVALETDVYPGRRFSGRVNKVMPVTDYVTRTTTVEVLADNPGYLLKEGMFARVSIDAGTRNVLAVSMDALMRMPSSGSYYCFKMRDADTVEKAYVETGVVKGGVIEIKEGLKEGDTVVVTSQGALETGKKVIPADRTNK